jgi:hypothetical protein
MLRGLIVLATAWLVFAAKDARTRADDPAVSSVKNSENRSLLLADDRARAAVGAGSVVGAGQPLTAAALLQAGRGFSLWSALPVDTESASKVPALVNLESVKDETPVRSGEEGLAFCEALVKAHKTSNEAFQNSATRGLTYANLFLEPTLHRGKVVHFEGRLKRLVRFEPPEETKLDGVTDQYEGWMFNPDTLGANPVCVVFTDLPAGLEPGDKLDVRVGFDGYFFKKYRYKGADTLRDAPLLIGHTIIVKQIPAKADAEEGGLFSSFIAVIFMVLLGCVFFLAFALTMWYRRSDQQVQQRVSNAQASSFMEPGAGQESQDNPAVNGNEKSAAETSKQN